MASDTQYGANPLVVSLAGSRNITLDDNGRTLITSGSNIVSTVNLELPAFSRGFRVRVGVNASGRPVKINTKSGTITFPRRSSLTGTNVAQVIVSYDPGAFVDLLQDPREAGVWRVVGGSGLWTSPLEAGKFFNLGDIPSAYREDFGAPTKASSQWAPVPVFDPVPPNGGGNNQFVVPSTQEMFDLLQPGMPLRWLSTIAAGWSYGIVESFEPAGYPGFDKAVVTFAGVAMSVTPAIIEVGPREVLRRVSLSFPGNFNLNDEPDMIRDLNKTYLTWLEGPAALVRVSTICITDDTTDAPVINVTLGGSAAMLTGLEASTTKEYSGIDMDPANYLVAFDESIEVTVTNIPGNGGPGSTKDAEDLTVEMIFVQDRPIAFWEPDESMNQYPSINLVISGSGGPLDGVWAVIPTMYNSTSGTWGSTVTGTFGTRQYIIEEWLAALTPYFTFVANYSRVRPSASASWIYNWVNRMSISLYSSVSSYVNYYKYSGVGRGNIMNGLMGSTVLVMGGTEITMTWWKVGSRWNSAFE